MKGYIYILSSGYELEHKTGRDMEVFDFYIQYEDEQFIKSSIGLLGVNHSHKEFYEKVNKYFVGDLKLMK